MLTETEKLTELFRDCGGKAGATARTAARYGAKRRSPGATDPKTFVVRKRAA